jgi:hypothetical protein
MSAVLEPKRSPKFRGDLASMAEALAQFAQTEFPQAESAQPRIAVLVPCFNEEAAVATVVADFRKALPSAEIFVYDNKFHRSHHCGRARGRRAGAKRAPPGQGSCGPADVRRYRR